MRAMSPSITPSRQDSPPGFIFDFDGTLGLTLPSWTSAFGAAMREHGFTPTEEELIRYTFHSCTDEVIRNHGIEDGPHFKEQVWSAVVEHMESVEHYPLVPETLAALRNEGCKLAVATNSRRVAVEPVLRRWNIHHHFDAILTIDDVSYGKPDPEMIHRALNKLGLSPAHTYIVGDSQADVKAGKRANIKTIAFSPEENRKYLAFDVLRDLQPSHLIHSYQDLWEILGLSKKP